MLAKLRGALSLRSAAVMLSGLVVLLVVAARVSAASSGDGSMSITNADHTVPPTSAAGGVSGQSFVFDFYNGSTDFSNGSQVVLTIPADWTAPSLTSGAPGYVTAVNGAYQGTSNTCNPTTLTIAGGGPWTVTMTQACGQNDHITITYSNVTPPVTTGEAVPHEFLTQTRDGAGGSLIDIGTSPAITVDTLAITFYKEICPHYTDVPANDGPSNIDQTGGHWAELNTGYPGYQTVETNPATDLRPACSLSGGWTFDLRRGSGGVRIQTVTTGTNPDGSSTVYLGWNDIETWARGDSSHSVWVYEETRPTDAGFGALRCYQDVLNGDNEDYVGGAPSGVTQTYCIAYNVNTPALSLTKSPTQTSFAQVDDTIDYTYTLTNSGAVTLSGPFTVSDDHIGSPLGSPIDCGDASTTLIQNAVITCSATYTISPTDFAAGSVTNSATATAKFGSNRVTSNAATAKVDLARPALSITKAATETTYSSTSNVLHYTIVLTNTGNVTLADPKVTDSLATDVNCGVLPTSLAPGGVITCHATHPIVQGDIDSGSVSNTATGTASFNSTTYTVTATAKVDLARPALSITKAATETTYSSTSNVLHYTIVLTNTGNVPLTDPSVSDPSATGLNCGGVLPTSLAPGGVITCHATHPIVQGDIDSGSVSNTATGTASFNSTTYTVTATAKVNATQRPALSITKTATETTYNSTTDVLHYKIVLTNTGNVPLTDPSVSDPSATGLSCDGGGAGTTLAPGGVITCTATHPIVQGDLNAGSVSNTATGTAIFLGKPVTAEATAKVNAAQGAALGIVKTVPANTTYSKVGDPIIYTYTLTNTGNVALDGPFSVTDNKITDPNSVSCPPTPTTLNPGEQITCTAAYLVTQDDVTAGSVTNSATAQGSFHEKPITSDPTSLKVTAAGPEGTEVIGGETASPVRPATPPVTSGDTTLPAGDSAPLFVLLLICFAFSGLGLLAVQVQRRTMRN